MKTISFFLLLTVVAFGGCLKSKQPTQSVESITGQPPTPSKIQTPAAPALSAPVVDHTTNKNAAKQVEFKQ